MKKRYPKWFLPYWNSGLYLFLIIAVVSFTHMMKHGNQMPGPAWFNVVIIDFVGVSFWTIPAVLLEMDLPKSWNRIALVLCGFVTLAVISINLMSWTWK